MITLEFKLRSLLVYWYLVRRNNKDSKLSMSSNNLAQMHSSGVPRAKCPLTTLRRPLDQFVSRLISPFISYFCC